MKKLGKKLMALAMAGVMMCSSIVATAAETVNDPESVLLQGSIQGGGIVDALDELDVFTVILPTASEYEGTKSPYNFTLDPQHLMYRSGRTTDADSTVWFANGDSTSAKLDVKSKSTMAVDVAISLTMDELGEDGTAIVMTDDKTFEGDTSTSLYMAVNLSTDAENPTPIEKGKTSVEASCELAAISEDNVQLTYDEDSGKYSYEYVGNEVNTVSFSITGACNDSKDADWGAVSKAEVKPTIEVAWSIAPAGGIQEYKVTDTVVINYSGDTPAITTIRLTGPDGGSANLAQTHITGRQVTLTAGTFTISPTYLAALSTASGYGFGTYSVVINSTTYQFKLVK